MSHDTFWVIFIHFGYKIARSFKVWIFFWKASIPSKLSPNMHIFCVIRLVMRGLVPDLLTCVCPSSVVAAGKIALLLPVLVKPSSMNPIQIVTKNPLLEQLKLNSSMLKLLLPLLLHPKLEPFLSFLDSSHVDYYLFAHFPVLITERNHGNFDAFLVSEDGRASFH